MNENENLVPKRRFKEFTNTGTWEQHRLGDMVDFFSGLTYSPDNVVRQPGTLVIRSSNVQNGEIVDADNVYVNNEVVNSDNVQVGDIAVVVRNGSRNLIGKHAAIKYPMKDTVIGAFMTGVRSDTPSFTNALLDSKQFEVEIEKNLGATINQITTGNFKKMTFNFPKVDERLKIGGFFNQLDNTIALHQRKLEKSKALKSAYLSEMFPAEGERKPKRRFAGFTDDWEQRKLGDLMTITSVKRIHQSDWTSSGVRVLRARDIVSAAKYEEPTDYLYISKEKYNEYSLISGKVTIGDLLVTGVGSIGVPLLITNGEPVYFKDGNVIWFKNNNVIDGNFFYYSFIHHKIQKFIKDVAGIGTVGTYTIDSGKKTPISLPIKKEQEKIGNLFKQFDDTIALHQHKLEKLQNIKQAYLNEIFV